MKGNNMFKKHENETPAEKRDREYRNKERILTAKIAACWIGSTAAAIYLGFYFGEQHSIRQFKIAINEWEAETKLRAMLPDE